MLKKILFIASLLSFVNIHAQALGGNAAFSFLKQPITTHLAALGNVNTSQIGNHIGLAFNNPALLRPEMDEQVNANFNRYFAGINNYSIISALHHSKKQFTHAMGIHFIDYGKLNATDAVGNILGSFSPRDYVIQYSISKKYKEKWIAGITAKWISSNYFIYKSNAIATDIGIAYFDSSKQLQISFLVKNVGSRLQSYQQNIQKEELPFDVQIGISKKLKNAPIQLSITAHQLQNWNLQYQDTSFNNEQFLDNKTLSFSEKVFSHLVAAAEIYIKDKIVVSMGYNFLQRRELSVRNASNGLNGISGGVSIHLKKIHLQYATGFFQQNTFNQLGITFKWNGNALVK
ncbi:MAG: type IX secretion system protein PorQ [Chitinophagaceae bacterium]